MRNRAIILAVGAGLLILVIILLVTMFRGCSTKEPKEKVSKKKRIEATVLNSFTPLSKSDICSILPDVSPTTVEAVLGAMVRGGLIRRLGGGRGTKYIKA